MSGARCATRASARAARLVAGGAAVAVVAGLVGACSAVRLQLEDLPEAPIALLHWADKAAEDRRELFEKMGEAPPIPPGAGEPELIAALQTRAYLRGDEILQLRAKFEEKPGRLMLFWPRTGELERIEAAPANAIPLAWSADGERLLIASAHRGEREQLYEYHRLRRDLRPVTRGPQEHARGDYVEASAERRGSIVVQRIAQRRDAPAPENTVHRLASTGRVGPVLARDVPPGTVRVSPDGGTLVFEQVVARERRDGPALLESFIAVQALARGSEAKRLIRGREPSITPDGQWIVFASPSSAGYRLRRIRPDGTTRVAIGPGGTEERMPSVSPDGRFVAFIQLEYGRRRLAVRRFDGKDDRVLLTSGWSEFPVWQ